MPARLEDHLLMLDEDAFLDSARLFLGKVEMPYNKAKVLSSLLAFFRRPEVRANLMASVTEEESEALSLVSALGPLPPGALSGALGTPSAARTVKGLLSRMLLVRDGNGSLDLADCFDYAPVLSSKVLMKWAKPRVDIRFRETMLALAGACLCAPWPKNAWALSRSASAFAQRLPLMEDKEEAKRLVAAFHRLVSAAAIGPDGEPDPAKLDDLLSRSDLQIKAALLAGGVPGQEAMAWAASASAFGAEGAREALGISGASSSAALGQAAKDLEGVMLCPEDDSEASLFVVSNDFTVRCDRLPAGSRVWMFTEPVLVDRIVTRSITKDSARAGFDAGLTVEDMIEELSAGGPPDPAVEQRLRSWREAWGQVKVMDGLYLEAGERDARLIDNLPLLQIHIIRKVSPTGYLMRRSTEEQWRRILLYSGFDMLGKTLSEAPSPKEGGEEGAPQWPEDAPVAALPAERAGLDTSWKERMADEIRAKAKQSSRAGYMALLEAGMILSPTQILSDKEIRPKRSVSGFDHKAKCGFVRAAAADPSLEIEVTTANWKRECFVAGVGGDGADMAAELLFPDGTRETVPVGKMFLIREI